MSKKRGKRPGLKARSVNARKPQAKRFKRMPQAMVKAVRESAAEGMITEGFARPAMCFYSVDDGVPAEGRLVLVKLTDGGYRFGMVVNGHFCAYEHNQGEYVQFAYPDRITHWMEIIPPAPSSVPSAQADSAEAEGEPPGESIEQAIARAAAYAPDRAEDVYA